jgi:hypothetical protein
VTKLVLDWDLDHALADLGLSPVADLPRSWTAALRRGCERERDTAASSQERVRAPDDVRARRATTARRLLARSSAEVWASIRVVLVLVPSELFDGWTSWRTVTNTVEPDADA